jgi:hypothetical protein
MARPCANCPFNDTGPGAELARGLRPGRMAEIKTSVLQGNPFPCHKTVDHDDDDVPSFARARECAGSIAFRNRGFARLAAARRAARQRAERVTRRTTP